MRVKILLFAIFWTMLAEAKLPKSAAYLSAPIGVIQHMKLVPDARVLYAGLPNPELLDEIYRNAPQANIDFSPGGGEYDNFLFFIAPESPPLLSWASYLKQGGRGGIVAFPLFLEGPFPFPDYFRMLEEMHMDILDWITRRFECFSLKPTHKFRKWIEESIIIPFGMLPSEALIDECIRLADTNDLIERTLQGEPICLCNKFQIILFERL